MDAVRRRLLIVFATTVVTAALTSLVGLPGIVIAIVMFVVLGNPTSDGSVPVQMLSGGYRFLAGVLPTNAAMGLVRSFAYFGGNQIARPLLVLSIYAGASLAVCLGLALRRAHVAVAKESAARAGTGQASTGRRAPAADGRSPACRPGRPEPADDGSEHRHRADRATARPAGTPRPSRRSFRRQSRSCPRSASTA